MIRRSMGQKHSSSRKRLFFETFVSIDLLGPPRNVLINCSINVKIHCGPLYFVSWHFSCSIVQKKWPKCFFQWKVCLFFKTFCLQQPLRSLKKCSHKFNSNCQNSMWILLNCSPMFVTLEYLKKVGQKNCHRGNNYFLKCLILSTSQVPMKRSYHLHKKTLKNLVDRYKVFPDVFHVGDNQKD